MIKNKISNPKLIIGALKECQFLEIGLTISKHNRTTKALITHILEENQFSDSENRHISITTEEELSELEDIQIFIPLGIANIKFNTSLQKTAVNSYTFAQPQTIDTIDNRTSKRVSIPTNLQESFGKVILKSGSGIGEVLIKLTNFSKEGVGAKIKNDKNVQPSIGSKISGAVEVQGVLYPLNHEITSLSPTESDEIKVGLRPIKTNGKERKEERRSTRLPSNRKIIISNILAPAKEIEVDLTDISHMGFSIRLDEPSHLIQQGGVYTIKNFKVAAYLYQALDSRHARFRITDGSQEERLRWLKSFDFKIEGSRKNLELAEEFISLFCNSGALSSTHLNNNRHKNEAYKKFLAHNIDNDPWIHRWISTGQSGEPNGHIASLRFGENTWLIGDIVGNPEQENKMPKTMRHSFLRSFSQWSMTSTPTPVHMVMWLRNHPYWKNYESYLESPKGREYILSKAKLNYFRLENFKSDYKTSSLVDKLKRIGSHDFTSIIKVQEELGDLKYFAQVFDFSINSFSSPNLKKAFKSRGCSFIRNYFQVDLLGFQGLAIFTYYPEGTSLNRVSDSIWFLQTRTGTEENRPLLNTVLHEQALKMGISAPSIRYLSANDTRATKEDGGVILDCYLISPQFWIKAQDSFL